MENLIKKIADNGSTNSLAHSMRVRRFQYFLDLIGKLKKPITILDIGGRQQYWENMGLDDPNIRITLLNLFQQEVSSPNFSSVIGSATDLSNYADNSFDIVYSNSVIEHLFTKSNQQKMANETRRVGRYHFIQTPNYFFPIEPHFLFPGFQFLPIAARTLLIHKFNLGWYGGRKLNLEEARLQVEEIRLLSTKEMRQLFPGSIIWKEKIGGLVKSLVAHNM